MKILVLQLARFGDIYLTWPTLRALHRAHPGAELHFLVREKFLGATDGLANIVVHTLPTAQILGGDEQGIESRLNNWLEPLNGEWDMIVNLSFSPVSSYLTDLLATKATIVRGYTRHEDGFLAIPDDGSAYFYAQVGIDRHNRFHLADIFAMVAQVDLQKSDWGYEGELPTFSLEKPYVVVHLGASQSEKRYPIRHFKRLLQGLSHYRVYLVGSKEEQSFADNLLEFSHIKSLIGQTTLSNLFAVIKEAELLIGADSAPIHIAAHVDTPVLNLSFSSVNFWETGPTSTKSWVIPANSPEELSPEAAGEAALALIAGQNPPTNVIVGKSSEGPRFTTDEPDFSWELIQALYTQANYPNPCDRTTISGVQRLIEVAEMALEQFKILKTDLRAKVALEILGAVDTALTQIAELAPQLSPLIRWFETERLRMPPQDVAITFQRTKDLFQDLMTIAQVLRQEAGPNFQELQRYGLERLREIESEIPDCALSFRLYQTAQAEPKLQRLLNHLTFFDSNGLHHAPQTKVGEVYKDWNKSYGDYREVLNQMIQAFQKQDYVYVADLIEYEIAGCLSQWRTQLVKFDTTMLA